MTCLDIADTYRAIRPNDPEVHGFALNAAFHIGQPPIDVRPVLLMQISREFATARPEYFGRQAAYPVHLARPQILAARNVELPTGDTGDLLRTVQPGLALAQGQFRPLERGDVHAQSGKATIAHPPL